MTVPTMLEGSVTLGGPGTAQGELEQKSGLVNEDNVAPVTPGFFQAVARLPWATLRWSAHPVHGHDTLASRGST
jgi:hypothetical protein